MLFFAFRITQTRLMLLMIIHGLNPSSKLKAILEGCANLRYLWSLHLSDHAFFMQDFFQPNSGYVRFTHVQNLQPKFYIGSSANGVMSREHSRLRKFLQLGNDRLVQAELSLRYWHEQNSLFTWAPLPIFLRRPDFRRLELALIQEWQPRLNYPFICQFFHPRKGHFFVLNLCPPSPSQQHPGAFSNFRPLPGGKANQHPERPRSAFPGLCPLSWNAPSAVSCVNGFMRSLILLSPVYRHNTDAATHGPSAVAVKLLLATSSAKPRRNIGVVARSFRSSTLRSWPVLNILARLLYQLIPAGCPHHFAVGDVYELLTILKSIPENQSLRLFNQDLAGFFTSIEPDRFIGAWYMLLDFLRPKMNVNNEEVFSVYPGKTNKPGDLIKGRTFRRLNVTRKIVIGDVPSLLATALDMQTFALGGRCIKQRRGSPVGSPLSPAMCLMVVSISEEIWFHNFKEILSNHHLFVRRIRYVDNRLLLGDPRLVDMPPYETLLDEGFYGRPILLETEPDQEFLGFMIATEPFELIYCGPTDTSQVLSPFRPHRRKYSSVAFVLAATSWRRVPILFTEFMRASNNWSICTLWLALRQQTSSVSPHRF
eukprot:s4270_g4.t1